VPRVLLNARANFGLFTADEHVVQNGRW